jgi:hypothetical protein
MFSVVNRCFQILTRRTEREWRRCSNLVVSPEVAGVAWDSFGCCGQLIQAGEAAVDAAMPEIEKWLTPSSTAALDPGAATVPVTA